MLFLGCVEPFDFSTEIETSSTLLVVEATLTNEMKKQKVTLSRTVSLSQDSIINFDTEVRFVPSVRFDSIEPSFVQYESGALVEIVENSGTVYAFSETTPGVYLSDDEFAAEENIGYSLNITMSNGKIYESKEMSFLGQSQIDALYAERITNDVGEDGMAIYADTSDPTNQSSHFRYTYEETYKIIAPEWTPFEFEILNDGSMGEVPAVRLVPRAQEEQVCYNTVVSSEIKINNTTNLESSSSQRNIVRFIDRNNPIISHRYSILVTQYLESQEAFNYYETLKSFSGNDNIFSETQPGFLEGNIFSISGDTNVLGYFDVVAVDQKRLFFNYTDYFPGEDLPPYFQDDFNCDRILSPQLGDPERDGPSPPPPLQCPEPLIPQIQRESIEYLGDNSIPPDICQGPYLVTARICGDCTIFGSNIVPDFWEE